MNYKKHIKIGLIILGSCVGAILFGILLNLIGIKSLGTISAVLGLNGIIVGFIFIIIGLFSKSQNKITSAHHSPAEQTYRGISTNQYDKNSNLYTYNKVEYSYANDNVFKLSWWVCLLYCFLFFPIGIYFIFKKLTFEKSLYFKNGVKLQLFSLIYFGISLLLVLIFIADLANSYSWGVILTPFAFGLSLLIIGTIYRKKGYQNDKFMTIITEQRITNIYEIARLTNCTYAKACDVIQKLIDTEFLPGAYIYHHDAEVIVHGISKKIACKCRNCGGTSVFYSNEKRICNYCGANI